MEWFTEKTCCSQPCDLEEGRLDVEGLERRVGHHPDPHRHPELQRGAHCRVNLYRARESLYTTFLCVVSLSQLLIEYIGAACVVTLSNIVAETSK
jgi:hypothetical protein